MLIGLVPQMVPVAYAEDDATAANALAGKTIACIGDSITAAYGVTKDKTDYVTLLAKQLGMNYIRLGVSGTTLCTDGSRTCNIGKLTEANLKGANIVTIAMGINDFALRQRATTSLGTSIPRIALPFTVARECGASYVDTYVNALGHDMGKWVVTKDASCTEDGEKRRSCSRCDFFETEEIAAPGHRWQAATCTEPKTCTVCKTTSGNPAGHIYSSGVDGTCDACGIHRENTEDRTVMNMFRMYDPNSGEHFYTGSTVERDNLVDEGWNYEGIGFTFSMATGAPVHRLYDPITGEHLYTMDEEEKAILMVAGWNYEGVAFNSAYDTEVPQYRLHNPNEMRGAYHFTSSIEERDYLLSIGWEDQGIGFYSSWK